MSMNQQTQDAFALFYGMSQSLGELAQPLPMRDEERVTNARRVFLTKIDADMAIELESCIHCGMCAEACHYYQGTGDPQYTPIRKLDLLKRVYRREVSPMRWLHRLYTPDITADDLRAWQPLVYDACTECGRCSMICPMGIHIAEMVGVNRQAMAEAGLIPDELRVMQEGQLESGQIFEAGPDVLEYKINEASEQLGFTIPVDAANAEVLVLSSGLDLMLFNDALAGTAKIMQHLGVPWSFCTEAYEGANFGLLSGHEETQRVQTRRILERVMASGAKVLITPECGHAFPALRWEGAEMLGRKIDLEILSISEYLGQQLAAGRLRLRQTDEPRVVALHDPCKVGRLGGSFEEGRAVVRAMGFELHETRNHHQYNYCCGGGAGVFLINSASELRQKAYEIKIDEVKQTGAESLVVSCGSCRLNFEVGKMRAHDTIEVDSLVALVAEHLAD